jgi:hypothetical protein
MDFEILSDITEIKKIAVGSGIRDIAKLRRKYGRGRWRKLKGVATIRLRNGLFGLPNYTGTKLMA